MTFSAVILAGGESRRMGRDKAWVEVGGESLIARALVLVRELGLPEVFISGRAGTDYSSMRYPVLFDLEPGCGPLGGIERALQAANSPLLLVLAVDLPGMTAACFAPAELRYDVVPLPVIAGSNACITVPARQKPFNLGSILI